jgi:hypothetical protein
MIQKRSWIESENSKNNFFTILQTLLKSNETVRN